MMEIEIEVFWHSDETVTLEQTGINFSMAECDTKDITFYHISCITPFIDEMTKVEYCTIHTNDRTFIATKSYKEIKQLIRENASVIHTEEPPISYYYTKEPKT